MSGPLSPTLRDKLVKVCARLGSDHDGERAAAALLADRILTSAGLSWDQVIQSGTQSDVSRIVMEAYRAAQANAAYGAQPAPKPRRPRRTPEQSRRSERLALLLAIIGGGQHLLKPHELQQYREGTAGRFAWNKWSPSAQAIQTAEYLAGVIRRRLEDAA